MSYYSVVRAEAAVINIESVEDAFEKLSAYFTEQRDRVGYWLYPEKNSETEIAVHGHEESGKAYDWEHELANLLNFVTELGGSLNGVFYREGEDSTDVERFIVRDNVITSKERAMVAFSDGEVYGAR